MVLLRSQSRDFVTSVLGLLEVPECSLDTVYEGLRISELAFDILFRGRVGGLKI